MLAAEVFFDESKKVALARHANVEIAVSGQNDPICAVRNKILLGDAVGLNIPSPPLVLPEA